MSKARNRSLFLRLGLVLAAEPELRLAGYLLTKRAELNHHRPSLRGARAPVISCPASLPDCLRKQRHAKQHKRNVRLSVETEETSADDYPNDYHPFVKTVFCIVIRSSVDSISTRSTEQIKPLINQSHRATAGPPTGGRTSKRQDR